MTRTPLPLAALALALVAAGPAGAATRTWQVSDFSRIRTLAPFDVRVRTGVPSGVRATGAQDEIDRLIVDQRGDVLVIRAQPGPWRTRSGPPPVIEVGARALAAATVAGSGDLAIDRVRGRGIELVATGSGDLVADALDVDLLKLSSAGSGDITVAGHADAVEAALVGSGSVRGAALRTADATVRSVGSGDAALGASRIARIVASGSGDVAIAGTAACTVSRSGSGDVSCGGRIVDED